MSAPPKTVLHAAADEAEAIRAAVREVRGLELLSDARRLAHAHDLAALALFLPDPAVSDPIYDLPRPFTEANVGAWIEEREARHARGEGALLLVFDSDGSIVSYADVAVWPERASAELAGSVRADRQNSGQGGASMRMMFEWMFEGLGVRLICLTAAMDNVRSARGIEAAGFRRMGERDCACADGSVRPSLYWEMTRDEWRARWHGELA
jgi:RimJ/RimL family protein N-acetyltransferase